MSKISRSFTWTRISFSPPQSSLCVCLLQAPVEQPNRLSAYFFSTDIYPQTRGDFPTLGASPHWRGGEDSGIRVHWLMGEYLNCKATQCLDVINLKWLWQHPIQTHSCGRLEMVQLPLISNDQCMEWYNRYTLRILVKMNFELIWFQIWVKTKYPTKYFLVRGLGGGRQGCLWRGLWGTPDILQARWQGWAG